MHLPFPDQAPDLPARFPFHSSASGTATGYTSCALRVFPPFVAAAPPFIAASSPLIVAAQPFVVAAPPFVAAARALPLDLIID